MNEEYIIRLNNYSKIDKLNKNIKLFDIMIFAKEYFYILDWQSIQRQSHNFS